MTSSSFLSISLTTPQYWEKTAQETDLLIDNQRQIFQTVNCAILSSSVGLFGIVANIINIIIFFRQGFTTTINISFFALAISDLCSLLTLEWYALSVNPLFVNSPIPMVANEVRTLTASVPHSYFLRVTGWIIAFVTAERCFCILYPLKVKQLITPQRAVIGIISVCLLNLLFLVPEYVTSYIDWKFYPHRNQTLLGVIFTKYRPQFGNLAFVLSGISAIIFFVAVILFTVILVVKLKQQAQWRSEPVGSHKQRSSTFSRDKQTMVMVAIIAGILIACYTPGVTFGLLCFAAPELCVSGIYLNLMKAMVSFGFTFQSVNASINIFFYYKMSYKYRQEFHHLFSACNKA